MESNTMDRTPTSYTVNLKKNFPLSPLLPIRKSSGILVVALAAIGLATVVNLSSVEFFSSSTFDALLRQALAIAACATLAVCLGRFVYEYLARLCIYYGIEDGHFVMSRGIIIKKRGYFPLSRITDVYLERSFVDLLFGLQSIHLSTPTSLSERFAHIEGLNTRTAAALQRKLTLMLERTHPVLEVSEAVPVSKRLKARREAAGDFSFIPAAA